MDSWLGRVEPVSVLLDPRSFCGQFHPVHQMSSVGRVCPVLAIVVVGLASCATRTVRQPGPPVALATPAVPRLVGEWVRLVDTPDLGVWSDPGAEPVDFTIWSARDGRWQLVACVRKTKFPGGGRLFYRWEAARVAGPYEPRGIFVTTDDLADHKPGHIQAPHVVRMDDRFIMLYNSDGQARALQSVDGKSFTPAAPPPFGGGGLFSVGRDVMLFDNRQQDQKLYAYYTAIDASLHPDRQHHTVAVRTATAVLGPWSAAEDVGVLTANTPGSPYNFINAESPFVIFHAGFYYRWEQMDVYASRHPTRWSGPPIARLTGEDPRAFYAPEIVEDQGHLYVAGYKYKQERHGIYMAEFKFASEPTR